MSIYIVTEDYNENMKIIAAFSTLKAATSWITTEATHRFNQDNIFKGLFTLQSFIDWFHIIELPLHEETNHLTKSQLKQIFLSKYFLQPATYETLYAISELLINYLEPLIPEEP